MNPYLFTRQSWMTTLADHHAQLRARYPEKSLMILFDIDGTIVDTRYVVRTSCSASMKNTGSPTFAR